MIVGKIITAKNQSCCQDGMTDLTVKHVFDRRYKHRKSYPAVYNRRDPGKDLDHRAVEFLAKLRGDLRDEDR